MDNFLSLGLPQPLLQSLEKIKFSTPTPIQAAAIPLGLAGRDIMGSAQTGTGKTAAFAIPLLARLMTQKQGMALVMTPTRELAAQIMHEMHKLLQFSPHIKTALLIGGEAMFKQHQQLRQNPRLIIGTPGRINDHLQQRTLNLQTADFLVLDETDRMLDMGFEVQIDRIAKHLPQARQTLMFSATLPAYIVKLSEKYLHNPARISVGSTHEPIKKINQELIRTTSGEKYGALVGQLNRRTGSVLVFVKTKHGADRLARKLNAEKHSAEAIHGNLNQNRRARTIQSFRDKKHRVMVATDIAARGLDIPHIEHVINYDLPQCPEDYIHRIGRTARAGAEGSAVCFITPEDVEKWQAIHYLMNPGTKPAVSETGYARQRGGYGQGHRRPEGRQRRRFGGKHRKEYRQHQAA